MDRKNESFGLFCAIILVIVIIFSLPTLVGGSKRSGVCNNHGYMDSYGACICFSGWRGAGCNLSKIGKLSA